MNLREAAKGKQCTLRWPGVCNHDPATVVLCHIRMPGDGIGTKPPDTCAFLGCHECHALADGRMPRPAGVTREMVELEAWRACGRTLREFHRDGWRMTKC